MRIRWRNLELPNRVVTEDQSINYGRFAIEPFERGFGTTIGNALRRILLSSLEGTAVTQVRIAGVDHEFMAKPGFYEDVSDMVLNIKQLLVHMEGTDATGMLTLKHKGKGTVTAGMIHTDHNTQIINKDLHLCTMVSDDAELDMTLTLRRGRGYVTSDENAGENREIGVIYVDSIFTPVKRVRYRTENTRVGKMTNYDKLIMEIWTDGTISPEMALVEAAKIMRKHLNPFTQAFELGPEVGQEVRAQTAAASEEQRLADLRSKLELPIGELDLSQRASNCIKAENIKTLADLCRRSENDMLKIRNFGKTTLREIKKKLSDFGLELGMNVDATLTSA